MEPIGGRDLATRGSHVVHRGVRDTATTVLLCKAWDQQIVGMPQFRHGAQEHPLVEAMDDFVHAVGDVTRDPSLVSPHVHSCRCFHKAHSNAQF